MDNGIKTPISSDHEMGGLLAAEYLIGLGYQKIVLVSPHSVNVSYLANLSLRIRGFSFALQQNNLPIRRDYFCFCAGEDQVVEAAKWINSSARSSDRHFCIK